MVPKLLGAESMRGPNAVLYAKSRAHSCPNAPSLRQHQVPKLEGLVVAARQRHAAVRRKGDGAHDTRVSDQGAKRGAGRNVPKLERLVVTARQRAVAVGREGHRKGP